MLSNNEILEIVKWHNSYLDQMRCLGVSERVISLPGLVEGDDGERDEEGVDEDSQEDDDGNLSLTIPSTQEDQGSGKPNNIGQGATQDEV